MQSRTLHLLAGAIAVCVTCQSAVAEAQQLNGNLGLHDPSSVHHVDGRFYVYYTGEGLGSKTSPNRTRWSNGPQVFSDVTLPDWHQDLVPANDGVLWAPDVAYFGNEYHLYYSVSSFGSQDSAIGLATSPTLNPADPNYHWTDRGPVIESNPGQNPYNTIDPAIIETSAGGIYMTFGSFWNGIYQIRLNPATGHRMQGRNGEARHLARRAPGQGTAIEAPYIYERDGQFYLFVNWGSCCNGVNSTYNIRMGRSDSVAGPFVDRNGVSMLNGGGTLFLGTEGDFIGPGHAAIFTDKGVDWFGYHYYAGTANGDPRYNLRTIYWDAEGWPFLGTSVAVPGDYNNDGMVSVADYVVFRNHIGTEFELPNRSTSLGGPIGQGDYDFWVANFGNSYLGNGAAATSGIPVPEPSTMVLAAAILAATLTARRT